MAETISLDSESAIATTSAKLNDAMIQFDRWASQNPDKLDPTNEEFRAMRQMVKILRLRLKELSDIQKTYSFALPLLQETPQTISSSTGFYTKSRNTEDLKERKTMKLGTRKGIKISRG
jgi:hypothetical protein